MKAERTGIVYQIMNVLSGKKYVGRTVQGLQTRWMSHRRAARLGSALLLHQAISHFGPGAFQVSVLSVAPIEQLEALEIDFIKSTKSHVSQGGYNMTWGGDGCGAGPDHPNYGKHRSSQTKALISRANKGRPHTEAWKRAHAEAMSGTRNPNFQKSLGPETRRKISCALAGEKSPSFGRRGHKAYAYGLRHTAEACKRISSAIKGEHNPNFGKHPSEETKKKLRAAAARRLADGWVSPTKGKHVSPETSAKLKAAWARWRIRNGRAPKGEVVSKCL